MLGPKSWIVHKWSNSCIPHCLLVPFDQSSLVFTLPDPGTAVCVSCDLLPKCLQILAVVLNMEKPEAENGSRPQNQANGLIEGRPHFEACRPNLA